MLVSDVINGLVMLAVTVLIATGQRTCSGTCWCWRWYPASRPRSTCRPPAAIVAELVPAQLLGPANSLMSLSQSLGQFLIGPLFGGILVALAGTGWAFGVDAVTFLVSAGCLALLRRLAAAGSRPRRARRCWPRS